MDWTFVAQTALRNNHLFCIRNYISEFLADGKWFIYISTKTIPLSLRQIEHFLGGAMPQNTIGHNEMDLIFFFFASISGQRDGRKIAKGHKASFCLEDTKCDPGFERVWNCTDKGDQGVSPGCYDVYHYNIDCQWVDCTDIYHGAYYLRVHVNPGNQVAESDFKNNVAKCSVYDYGSYIIANRCWLGESNNVKATLCYSRATNIFNNNKNNNNYKLYLHN